MITLIMKGKKENKGSRKYKGKIQKKRGGGWKIKVKKKESEESEMKEKDKKEKKRDKKGGKGTEKREKGYTCKEGKYSKVTLQGFEPMT